LAFFTLGAAGGLVAFLVAVKNNHYRNDQYIRKLSIEIIGGAITGACLVPVFSQTPLTYVFAFLIGTAWAYIIQKVRSKFTRIIEAALGDTSSGGGI
jgi:hypothetical protein